MKNKLFLLIVITTAFFYASCSKDETENSTPSIEDTYATAGEQRILDSVLATLSAENPVESNFKAGPAVTLDFTQQNCNTFNLSVNLHLILCPRQGLPLRSIITIFDSKGIRQLPVTTSNSCIQGNLARFDLRVDKDNYIYVVLLVMEGTQVHSLFVSRTVVLKPTC